MRREPDFADAPKSAAQTLRAIKGLRLRLRVFLSVDAMGRLLTATIAIGLVIATLDWLVRFPDFVRLCILLLGAGIAAVWACRKIARPLLQPIPLDQLALGLKGLPAGMRDELASAVSYLRGAGDGSAELWRRVFEQVGGAAELLQRSRLLNHRGLIRTFAALAASILPVAAFVWIDPGAAAIGVARVFHPLGGDEWPRSRQIEPLTADAVVAVGESFTAQMRLTRGDKPNVRAYLHWALGNEKKQRTLMRRDADGIYRLVLDNLRLPVRYYFVAGDDDTSEHASLIRVVQRPEIESITMDASPPAYARHLPTFRDSLDDRVAEVLEGSLVAIAVRPSKQPATDAESTIRTLNDAGESREWPLVQSDDGRLRVEFEAREPVRFDVSLIDRNGLRSRGGEMYQLVVRLDESPLVSIVQPESVIEVTADAVIAMRIKATDDVGLQSLTLYASRNNAPPTLIAELIGDASGQITQPRELTAEHDLSLKALSATIDDTIEYYAEARDAFLHDGRMHDPVRSPVGRIRVVSSARIGEKLRLDLLSVREQLRRLMTSTQGSMKRTAALEVGPAADVPLSDTQKADARQLASDLDRLGAASQASAETLALIYQEALRNSESQSSTAQQARRLAGRLMRESLPSARQAQESAFKAAESPGTSAQLAGLRAASAAQQEFVDSLRSVLSELERWNQYDDLVRQLRDVLDRQESLEREFASSATPSAESGESAETDEEQRRVGAALSQSLLRSDAADLLVAMDAFAQKRETADRLAAESVRAALVVASQEGVLERMDEAVGAGQAGQFARAVEHQRNAAAGLRAMLSALDSKPDRELAELSRDLKNILARLDRIIASQQTLIDRTRAAAAEADPTEEYEVLADRQYSLQSTAGSLQNLLKAEQPDARSVGEHVRRGRKEMGAASLRLESLSGEEAGAHQLAAKDALEAAKDELLRIENRVDEEIGQRSLDAMIEALRDVRAKEQAIRAETSDIAARANTDGDLTRPDMFRLARLGKLQLELAEPIRPLVEKLGENVVYSHVLTGVVGRVEKAASLLSGYQVRASLLEEDRIIRDLGWLIDSVDENERANDPTFVQDSVDAGGGAAGQPTASKPVPKLAELKVLRAMQADVKEQTASLAQELPEADRRTETHIRQIELLGVAQSEIQGLAAQMIADAEKEAESK